MAESYTQNVSHIGAKLRAARLQRRMRLRELAEKAEVSPSLLSKIENNKATPSVRSLHSIAEALSLPVYHFFPEENEAEPRPEMMLTEPVADKTSPFNISNMTPSQIRAAQAAELINEADFGFDGAKSLSKEQVVRAGRRPKIELLGGITWERLTPNPEDGIEFLQACYEVGGKSGEKMSHHSGRELQYVLEGELLLELGFERYLLKAGDSIIFDSTLPHRLSNAGDTPMHIITVIFNHK
ncbi:MAG: cupin domain-containing protein [Anaerolineae bacterium]